MQRAMRILSTALLLSVAVAATALAADRGVAMVRAHQARATRETCEMVATVRGERNPSRAVRLLA